MGADGAVWFCHWGCKHTLGGARLGKKALEEAGLPTLLLDGDSCDQGLRRRGQAATRMEAFGSIGGHGMSITYHVCKYTPTELLTALGGQCALLTRPRRTSTCPTRWPTPTCAASASR